MGLIYNDYLDGPNVYACNNCTAHFAYRKDMISQVSSLSPFVAHHPSFDPHPARPALSHYPAATSPNQNQLYPTSASRAPPIFPTVSRNHLTLT